MMTKTKKMLFGLAAMMVVSVPFFATTSVADARFNPDPTKGVELGVSRTGRTDLVSVIFAVIKGLLSIVFVVAVLMFVIAGIFFLTAANSDRADLARDILTYAIIGLVVSVLGYAIVLFLSNVLTGRDTGSGGSAGISVSI